MRQHGTVWVGVRSRLAVAALATLPTASWAEVFDRYERLGQFSLPAGTDVYDVLADGRLIALVDDQIYVETAVGARTFQTPVTLPEADLPFFGAAFLRVSPGGTRFAVGNNGGSSFSDFRVGVFDVGTLAGAWLPAGHFDAEWFDEQRLAITAGDFGSPSVVTLLDVDSLNPLSPSNPTVIGNIGGASGGITFDAAGNLFTGNGFTSTGPSGTGTTRAFPRTAWEAAAAGGPVINFETDGVSVVDVLSASPLGFDAEGNLFVGGGDVAPDSDFIALVRSSAVLTALAGGGAVDANDPTRVRRLDPIPENDANFFSATSNAITGELYVRDPFVDDTVHVYRDRLDIPAVSPWGMTILIGLLLCAATIRLRRSPRRVTEDA